MNSVQDIRFKRVARVEAEDDKHFNMALASNNSFSITQFMYKKYADGSEVNMPLPGAVRCTKASLFPLLDLIIWTVLRINEKDIPEPYKLFMKRLRNIMTDQVSDIEESMRDIGFPPTSYSGESYYEYAQLEEEPTKNRYR